MPFIQYTCRICNKKVTEVSSFKVSGNIIRKLSCNHSQIDKILEEKVINKSLMTSIDGKEPYPFQIEGIKAAEAANMNFLFADEMGLGKTIQILLTIKLHQPEVTPVAIICKSALKAQWSMEIARWFGVTTMRYIVESAKDLLPRNIPFYIFSYDILRRYNGKIVETFKELGIKTIVLDECQHIKNYNSERSKHVRELCAATKYKMAASGTPIKNHAGEYFPILNILAPQYFRNQAQFYRDWCDSYWNGYAYKAAGLRYPEEFREFTKDFIIRRERKDVDIQFPDLDRTYQYHDLGKEVEESYQATLDEFCRDEESGIGTAIQKAANRLAYLSRMRHLTGLSKVKNAIDFVDDFISSTDRKLTLFVHHKDVGLLLNEGIIKSLKAQEELLGTKFRAPQMLTADLGTDERLKLCEDFQNKAENRILIASTLASGEGLNLQKCSDCVMVERQWNPANEEQAEGRFIRIGSTASKVHATYLVAIGTIDEYFAELVERKRAVFANVMNGVDIRWDESSLMKELTEELIKRNKKRWK